MTLMVQSKPDHLKSRGSGPVIEQPYFDSIIRAYIHTDLACMPQDTTQLLTNNNCMETLLYNRLRRGTHGF